MESGEERTTGVALRSEGEELTLDRLAADIEGLEKELLPQLDLLAERIPELYGGYASMVREIMQTSLSVLRPKSSTASKLAVAAEIGARGLEAYGAYKAAKKHNEMLDKFLMVKKEIANLNYGKVSRLLPEVERKLGSSERLFDKLARNSYLLKDKDRQTIIRTSNLVLRTLTLYRSNLFLLELCRYLRSEYEAWLSGSQTSGLGRPDYFVVNGLVVEKLFGKRAFATLEKLADGNGDMSGKELMLMADPQLFAFAMKDKLCEIDVSKASPAVEVILKSNPGCEYYAEATKEIRGHVGKNPHAKVLGICCAVFVGMLVAAITYNDCEPWVRVVVFLALAGVVIRVGVRSARKMKLAHVAEGITIGGKTDRTIGSFCGKTEETDIDYDRKNTGMAAVNAFFGNA